MSNYKIEADRVATTTAKKEYNRQLRIARRAAASAAALRESIVDSNPKLSGPSTARLAAAVEALSAVRVFKV
jgi:hypothetical protein